MNYRNRPVAIAPLEPRLMLARSFTLTSGTLRLTCDATSQYLSVKPVGDKIRATLYEGDNQLEQQEWTTASVTTIQIFCDAGDDKVIVSSKIKKSCIIGGGAGNDTLTGGGGNDTVAGTDGNDLIDGGGGSDSLVAGGGIDTVDYSSRTGNLTIREDGLANDGEAGENDSVDASFANILGGSGNDYIVGLDDNVNGANHIVGNDGNDTLLGLGGNDTLDGGAGNDRLEGGEASDVINGDSGKDTIDGGSGNDLIHGGSGNDVITGGKSADQIFGDSGDDKIAVKDGSTDHVDGGSGVDSILDRDGSDKFVSV